MDEENSPGGKILPFPVRSEDRLRHALRKLEQALAQQGNAVAGFRAEIGALSSAMAGLDGSLEDYRTKMAGAVAVTDAALNRMKG